MSHTFKPMLAATLPCFKGTKEIPSHEDVVRDLNKLDFSPTGGFLCSIKLDGVRAIKHPTLGLLSRSLTPIPNRYIQQLFADPAFDGFDGELVVGSIADQVNFNTTQSAVMTMSGTPDITFNVFDDVLDPEKYFRRVNNIAMDVEALKDKAPIVAVSQIWAETVDDVLRFEEAAASAGYEGIIIRHRGCLYKNGRSTFREQGMIKLKRFVDAEAVITGFEELMHNGNEAFSDNLGYQKRSSHQANQIPGNTLGKLVAVGLNGNFEGVELRIGSGFDMATRDLIWRSQDKYKGMVVKYKYQEVGAKDAPRAPIFLGLRCLEDM